MKRPSEMITEVIAIIDASGSMSSTAEEIIGGFNKFIKEQKDIPGKMNTTVAFFDNTYKLWKDGESIHLMPLLDRETYTPGGMTALYDAVCMTVDRVSSRIGETEESKRPDKVICVIMTDGHENSSQDFVHKDVLERIQHHRKESDWEFVFLGANIEAQVVGESTGISRNVNYVQTRGGTSEGMGVLNYYAANMRQGLEVKSFCDTSECDEAVKFGSDVMDDLDEN